MKTKSLLNVLFLIVLIKITGILNAQEITVGYLNYFVNDDGASVTVTSHVDGQNATGELIIPESVTFNGNNYYVTIIGDEAFYYCRDLTGNLIIPNSATEIKGRAFSECSRLTSINIPNSVTYIGYGAFGDCDGLTSVYIPNSVTQIECNPFCGCLGLEEIIVDTDNPVYDSRNNCNGIIETATSNLIAGCTTTIIPNTVLGIGYEAFEGFTALSNIQIPNSVTSIAGRAFASCGLTSIYIPSSVINIDYNPFVNCQSLEEITVDPSNPIYDSRNNCNAIIQKKYFGISSRVQKHHNA